jgi:hypothetical protein
MRNEISIVIAVLTTSFVLFAAPARAGVVITITDMESDAGQGYETKAYLEPDQVKMETAGGGIIFHDGSKTFTRYSDRDRTYSEMTPAAMKAMQTQALATMREQMAKMPEAQRKQMEALLERQGMGPAPAKPPAITYHEIARGQTVGAWPCDQFEQLADDKKVAELCIAHLADVGLTEADLTAFKNLAKAIADMGPRVAQARSARFDLDGLKAQIGFAGLPVRTVEFVDNQQGRQTIVKTIERLALPATTFQVPAGYAKQDLLPAQ